MKSILIAILLSTQLVHAQDVNCDPKDPAQQFLSMASDISLPNCVNEANISAAKSNDASKLCGECKAQYESRNDSSLVPLSKDERQAIFVEAALKEYKKNITNSLVDTLKLRSLRPTGSDFKASTSACKMKSKSDIPKSCSASAVRIIEDKKLFNDFDREVQNELAKIISTDEKFAPNSTLLKRSAPQCYIPEKNALYISSSAAEESFSPALIKALLAMDPSKFRSTSSMFMSENLSDLYDGEMSELFGYLSNHPLMGDQFKSPATLITFLKSIPEPKDISQLRSTIYNKKTGDEFDAKMSSACKLGFEALVKNICSEDFEKGNFELSPFVNESKLLKDAITPSEEKLASNDKLIKLNSDVLKLCETAQNSKIKFSTFDSEINSSLQKRYQSLNLEQFKQQKFDSDIGNMTNNICSSKDKDCSDNTILCKMIAKFKALNDPTTVDFKLANSSNKEVNELLRSMIGDTSKIDSKTKDILIAQGIIPKEDGTMVKQPEIPERQPDFVQKEAKSGGATLANAKAGAPTNVANSAKSGRNPSSESSYQDEGYSNTNTKSSSNTLPDFSDLMDDQQELKGIQDEIKRRLLGLPENKPANLNDAKKIARDSFKSRGKRISPEQEDAFATRMMQQPDAQAPQTANTNTQLPNTNSENRAQVSGGESAQAKWRKGQDQAALMGMKGAQDVLNKDGTNAAAAADAKPKDMTKVALNLADDPRVTLSDMFNKKIDQNDPETQLLKVLLRNKNNFLLQVKAMNFKIIFDDKNNFNLLLESGDQQEAARIRPQLEMFLKKLKT